MRASYPSHKQWKVNPQNLADFLPTFNFNNNTDGKLAAIVFVESTRKLSWRYCWTWLESVSIGWSSLEQSDPKSPDDDCCMKSALVKEEKRHTYLKIMRCTTTPLKGSQLTLNLLRATFSGIRWVWLIKDLQYLVFHKSQFVDKKRASLQSLTNEWFR